MQFTPYLNFNGNCAEAFAFYASIFNGQVIEQFTFDEMPDGPPVPAEAKHQIMHACLQIGEQILMGSDAFPSAETGCAGSYQKPQGLWVSISLATEAEGQTIFNALAEGGQIQMPYEPTFWAKGFGMVEDRFGTPWMINVFIQES